MLKPEQEILLLEERKRELMRAAKLHQLYREARDNRPRMSDRLMHLIGDLMITSGTKLKARSDAPPMPLYCVEPAELA